MPTETGVSSILGIENKANKDQLNGYPGLDASGYLSANEISYISLIPNVFVDDVTEGPQIPGTHYFAPFIDDAPTYSNLIFVATGHYISFDGSTHCINMRKII